MNLTCEVVLDLLPLYHDDVVNPETKKAVQAHLQNCENCRTALEKIKTSQVDTYLKTERANVVQSHQKAVMRKSFIAGVSVAAVLAVPILITFIVNLAVGRTLDWFFIVLASMLTVAAVTVVPLVMEKNKGMWTLCSFTAGIGLILASSAIFSGGNWFFVAMIPVIFGLFVVFGPFVVYKMPLTAGLKNHKGLVYFGISTTLLCAVIITAGIYSGGNAEFWRNAFLFTSASLTLPWGMFLVIRYLKANGLIKAGLCVLIVGVFTSTFNAVASWILTGTASLGFYGANLFSWDGVHVTNANINVLIILVSVVVGAGLLLAGFLKKKR